MNITNREIKEYCISCTVGDFLCADCRRIVGYCKETKKITLGEYALEEKERDAYLERQFDKKIFN